MTKEICIDFSSIDFPSDGLTIKFIRQRWPESVDYRVDDQFVQGIPRPFAQPIGEYLYYVIKMERDLAVASFNSAMGKELPDLGYSGDDIRLVADDLSEF